MSELFKKLRLTSQKELLILNSPDNFKKETESLSASGITVDFEKSSEKYSFSNAVRPKS